MMSTDDTCLCGEPGPVTCPKCYIPVCVMCADDDGRCRDCHGEREAKRYAAAVVAIDKELPDGWQNYIRFGKYCGTYYVEWGDDNRAIAPSLIRAIEMAVAAWSETEEPT